MQEVSLAVEKRDSSGKGVARKLRSAGTVPAILYGRKEGPQRLGVPSRELIRLLKSAGRGNVIIQLAVGQAKPEKVLLKDIQRHPVTEDVLHVDFLRIDPTKKLHVDVPIKIIGIPVGVKTGGMLEIVRREIEVSCLPDDIPAYIEIDVTALEINDALHVSDLSIEKGEILTNPARTIVTVQPPIVSKVKEEGAEGEEGEGEEAEGEGGEPEVIKEKKEED
ncbi:MAG: 50S ribosomal protein L25/general stress protein Ctc [bacterium]